MAVNEIKVYRDSRGNEWKIAEMKTAKLANVYNATAKKVKNLENAVNCKGYANPAQERKITQHKQMLASLKAELVYRNPFDLEGILNGI